MTTPNGSRGGSMPPRPPAAAGKPQQWLTLRPWVLDVTLASVLPRAAPAGPPQPPGTAPHPRNRRNGGDPRC